MSDFQTIADRVEIEALRGEFTDAAMMRDYGRLASLFTPDGALRMPNIPVELVGQEEIRAWGERVPDLVDFLVQNTHPGTIQLEGDTASGRAYMSELWRTRDGRQGLNSPSTTTATSAPATAGSSPSASTRSDTRTPHRWRARRPAQPGRPLIRRPGRRPRRKHNGDHARTAFPGTGIPVRAIHSTPATWPRRTRSLRQRRRSPAALALAEAVTRLADRPDPVPDAIWDEATRH
jgi:ketosteroid isomerase-like protein